MEGSYGSSGTCKHLGRYVGELRYGQTSVVLSAIQEIIGRIDSTKQESVLDHNTSPVRPPRCLGE